MPESRQPEVRSQALKDLDLITSTEVREALDRLSNWAYMVTVPLADLEAKFSRAIDTRNRAIAMADSVHTGIATRRAQSTSGRKSGERQKGGV